MAQRKPAVIATPELAAILTKFVSWLKTQPEEFFEVSYDTRPSAVPSTPSLSVIIKFDPKTLTAKTVTVSNMKRAVKEWNADHGVES